MDTIPEFSPSTYVWIPVILQMSNKYILSTEVNFLSAKSFWPQKIHNPKTKINQMIQKKKKNRVQDTELRQEKRNEIKIQW